MKFKKIFFIFLFILILFTVIYKINLNYLESKRTIIGTYYTKDYNPFNGKVVSIVFDIDNNFYLNFNNKKKKGVYIFNKDKNLLSLKLENKNINIHYNLKDKYLNLPIIDDEIYIFKIYKMSEDVILSE